MIFPWAPRAVRMIRGPGEGRREIGGRGAVGRPSALFARRLGGLGGRRALAGGLGASPIMTGARLAAGGGRGFGGVRAGGGPGDRRLLGRCLGRALRGRRRGLRGLLLLLLLLG